MNNHVDGHGAGTIASELEEKIKAVLKLFAAENEAKLGLFKALAVLFVANTPYSWLASPSPAQLAEWLRAFLDLLGTRRGPAAVRLLPFGPKGRALLLTNTPDAPFLLDSLQALLPSMGLHFQVVAHPILTVRRHRGEIVQLGRLEEAGSRESLIVIELEKIPEDPAELEQRVVSILTAVLRVHHDQSALDGKLKEREHAVAPGNSREFCHWLRSGNFLPFAYRCLQLEQAADQVTAREVEDSRVGLAPLPGEPDLQNKCALDALEPAWCDRLLRPNDVVVETIGCPSPVLRDESLVYLGFREPVRAGVWLEHSFLGLFSEQSTDELTCSVPSLRRRIEAALDALAIPKGCHDYRKTVEIFNSFPKIELFFMEPAALLETIRSFTML